MPSTKITESKKVSVKNADPNRTAADDIDLSRLEAMTDDEIREGIAKDPDAAPELDEAFFKLAHRHEPAVPEMACPDCDSRRIQTLIQKQSFLYGEADDAVKLFAEIPAHTCEDCGAQFIDSVGEEVQHRIGEQTPGARPHHRADGQGDEHQVSPGVGVPGEDPVERKLGVHRILAPNVALADMDALLLR